MKIPLLAAAIIAVSATAFVPAQAHAQIGFSININSEPPPPRYEPPPPPRVGNVWITGFWNWDGYRHVWQPGHWERARVGMVYEQAVGDHVDGRWRLTQDSSKSYEDRDYEDDADSS